jgi:hypothetical protein
MKFKHALLAAFFAVTGVLPQAASAQIPPTPSPSPVTGDRMPTADQLPAKPTKADRKAAREARRPEATAAARNPDYSGGVYNPVAPRPKSKTAPKPASAP